jgi:apolipoprotein N-acyltransferase
MSRSLAAATAAALLLWAAARVDARLAWLVCAPLVAAVPIGRRGWSRAGWFGAVFAIEVALALHLAWLAEAAERYFAVSRPIAVAAALALCLATAAPAGWLLGLLLRSTASLAGGWPIAGSAAVWAAWEELTRIVFPSYPWVGLAATQADTPSVLQAASVAGQGGLSLALAAAGCAVGYALRPRAPAVPTGASGRARAAAILFAAVLATAIPLLGAARLRAAPASGDPLCTLAAVDADIRSPRPPGSEVLERYTAASAPAIAIRPDAVIWPESALPADPFLDADLLRRLRALAASGETVLVAGGPRSAWGPDWGTQQYNSVFRIAPEGPIAVYDKRATVPFAESWPGLLPRPSGIEVAEIARGEAAPPMRAGACEIGVLVCFEAERAGLARELAASGADALVVATNDAQLPARAVDAEVAEARLRAVETGLPVLRAANRGLTLAVDRFGRDVGERTGGVVVLRVGRPELAPAVRWATPLVVLCGAAAVLASIRAWRAGNR